jgi:hypothetical protein
LERIAGRFPILGNGRTTVYPEVKNNETMKEKPTKSHCGKWAETHRNGGSGLDPDNE